LINSKADVVIIGGGVIGTSIAYHLARRKIKVTLLEKDDLASASSGSCDGLIFLQTKKPGIHLQMAIKSRGYFEQLQEDLPVDIEYEACGGMVVIETEGELDSMRTFVEEQQRIGLDVSLLDIKEARYIEPHLCEDIMGATYSALDGKVNPIALTYGFALGARQHKANIITGATVKGLTVVNNRITYIETENERFEAPIFVNAAGIYAPEIGKQIGVIIPITPRRGQILVTEFTRPLVRLAMVSAKYIATKFNSDFSSAEGEGVSIDQTVGGNFLLGSTREFVGFDNGTSLQGVRRIADQSGRIIPDLRRLHVIRSFAGLRPYTPDGLPILGPVEGLDGLIMAAGHEGDGIALSPITGDLIAQLISEGSASIPLGEFRLERFMK
jgi:glycine/D-amino acid oxidase-like deaminating enzyme